MDFSPVILANIAVSLKTLPKIEESNIRYMVLQSIGFYKKKFGNEYGQLVIAVDSHSWRKEAYPYYKYMRKVHKENDTNLDWDMVFKTMESIVSDLDVYFPYNVIKIPGAEADDIIGALTHEYGVDFNFGHFEPILIVSGDHDFIQLHKYANVKQFSPREKKFVKHSDPEQYLFEHIVKGDKGDGVPNILSDDDTFVTNTRQKPVTAKLIGELKEYIPTTHQRNFDRNKLMVDLSQMPEEIKSAILDKYNQNKTEISESTDYGNRVMSYMSKHRLRKFLDTMKVFL